MQAAEVTLEKIGKRYADQWVVRNVDLGISRGEFFTLLGPSGCGKTTLLRMIAGFAQPDEGVIRFDGQPVNQVPPWRRDVGMVFQSYALWPHLTVFDNVAFGLRERKFPRDEITKRVRAALDQVELTGTEARRPSQLSGGQQQRVALARTLVIQPRVLLLDEPLSNLDAKLRVEMRLELQKLQRDLGLTTIYVTHDQEEALALSTRIAVINRGQIVQQGEPRVIYEQPTDDFVAGFIGQANLLPATVESVTEHELRLFIDSGVILNIVPPAKAMVAAPTRPGDTLSLSIRPEAIQVSDADGQSGGAQAMIGRIAASAYQGAFVEYEIGVGGHTLKARVANPKGKQLYQRGAEVKLTFAAEDLVIVPKSGN
jgi:spermidine/putrescine ABC transporter ATP-binding subunit